VAEGLERFLARCREIEGLESPPVLLVGGASRLPGLKQRLEKIGGSEVYQWNQSDYATVLGAVEIPTSPPRSRKKKTSKQVKKKPPKPSAFEDTVNCPVTGDTTDYEFEESCTSDECDYCGGTITFAKGKASHVDALQYECPVTEAETCTPKEEYDFEDERGCRECDKWIIIVDKKKGGGFCVYHDVGAKEGALLWRELYFRCPETGKRTKIKSSLWLKEFDDDYDCPECDNELIRFEDDEGDEILYHAIHARRRKGRKRK
jgi:predicted RNA-binding Zn-ribbon protein involved in translation (DUF1610 family)